MDKQGKVKHDFADLNFRSRFDYIKSIQDLAGLNDEEANTFLWILEMWDKKKYIDPPTDFKLKSIGDDQQ